MSPRARKKKSGDTGRGGRRRPAPASPRADLPAAHARVALDDELWMGRALALARRGLGTTRPNPMVGAVVVRDGRVIGEGFHQRAGQPHAEVNALTALERAGESAAGATVYVNLEPCAHVGRTAPCVDALIAARVARVVVGVRDPNPLVDGRGLGRLRAAGIRVDVDCLADDCRERTARSSPGWRTGARW